MSQVQYKYKIPRNVKARFELFGLTGPRFVVLLPFAGLSFFLFKVISGPPAIVLPIVIMGLGYFLVTNEIEGETIMELVENWVRDFFQPKLHLWEEENHDRFYEEKK